MKSTYTNSKHPKLVLWGTIAFDIILIALMIILPRLDKGNYVLEATFITILSLSINLCDYYRRKFTIDTEADTFIVNKNYPMKISKVKTITFKESRKGKFRALLVHDDGVGFFDIRTSTENAELMTVQLVGANPNIEVRRTGRKG